MSSAAEALSAPASAPRQNEDTRDWLVGAGLRIADQGDFMEELARRLQIDGVPVDRITTAIETLHADYSGIGRFWTRGEGSQVRYYPYADNENNPDAVYRKSPFFVCEQTGRWCRFNPMKEPNERFGIIPELKAAGYTDYICIPIVFSGGEVHGLTLATREAGGFSESAVATIRALEPSLTAHMEIRSTRQRMDFLLRFYVGNEPAQQIFSGVVRRGRVNEIRSAILVADMRSYTALSHGMPPEQVAAMLNRLFDCIVPPIEAQQGEVLKFMGDGLLAIFRDRSDDVGSAAQSAYDAAREGLRRVRELDALGELGVPLSVGYALHHGRAAYGNVGSGTRLDFTIVGADVNIASRLASLNQPLGEPLLMSEAFTQQLWIDATPLGAHALKGVPEPVKVFGPATAV